MCRLLLAQLLLLACVVPASWGGDEARETWNVIYIGGTRVGYSRSNVQKVNQGGTALWKCTSDTHLVIRRFGQDLKMHHHLETTETDEGNLLQFRYEMHNPPAKSNESVGEIREGKLHLTTTVFGVPVTRTFAWDPTVKSPAYQDRLLETNPLQPGETRKLKAFVPDYNKVSTITLKAEQPVQTELLDGVRESLLLVKVSQSLIPGVVTQMYLSPKAEAKKTATSMLGTEMFSYLVSREEALKELGTGELDLGLETLVRVSPIPQAHRTRAVTYRVKISENDLPEPIPSGASQQVRKIGNDQFEVTVTGLRPKLASALPRQPAGKEYREPSRFLQSDDRRVRQLAQEGAGSERDPWTVACCLEKHVHQKLTRKDFSTAMASAAEVAESLQGDCTEHACLLAAMARAQGIPARVAVGLVYVPSKQAFGGHMWTEVNIDDHWIPLDATLAFGGIGGAHLKLADSSLADDSPSPGSTFLSLVSLLGKIKIEVVSVEQQPAGQTPAQPAVPAR